MLQSQLFREISSHRRLVEKNKKLFQLFIAAFEVTDNLKKVSELQKEFIITELCFSYSYFGYSLFVCSSIQLVAKGMSILSAVEEEFIQKYMLHLKEFLVDEIQIEKKSDYFTEENLEFAFAREFVKRIFCTEQEEDIQSGLLIFDKNYVSKIRDLSRKKILEYSTQAEIQFGVENLRMEREIIYFENIYNEFILFLSYLKSDPLTLIVSRFESFINFFKNDSNSYFIFKEQSDFMDEKSKKITAILTLLIPHIHREGQVLFKDSMLTINQITKVFSPKFKSKFFNLKSIQSWLVVDNGLEFKSQIEFLMEEAVRCGVVFKVPQGNKDFTYGLSESGLKIIQPFRTILTDSFCIY